MRVWIGALAAGLVAAGCTPMEEDLTPTREDARYTCDAARVQTMIGQVASQGLGTEAVRASGARTLRWIAPGMAVTMDYRTDRLNIHLDAQNRVTRVDCG